MSHLGFVTGWFSFDKARLGGTRRVARALGFAFLALLGATSAGAHARERITVFAPSSMTDMLTAAKKAFEAETGGTVVFSFAASSKLARQVLAGAPADLFISAHPDWSAELVKRGIVSADAVAPIAGNRLVLAVRHGPKSEGIENGGNEKTDVPFDLLRQGRFAMGDPVSVPAGQYAKEALQAVGLWDGVKDNAVYGENVRVALFRLAQGAVSAAIVYESDVVIEPRARIAFTFEPKTHSAIRYWAATLPEVSPNRAETAQRFLTFLRDKSGAALLKRYGFSDFVTVQP
ncbi:MAG: molybdate ABC transporter substrate-binding protein [Pseudomonadota bacterium]